MKLGWGWGLGLQLPTRELLINAMYIYEGHGLFLFLL